ncbi:MAG: Ig-like domain-containing protein [Lachnospiraceae bacterium]|nr:Ig-like domain-containing protein [Lachnospiraceae bacterium]
MKKRTVGILVALLICTAGVLCKPISARAVSFFPQDELQENTEEDTDEDDDEAVSKIELSDKKLTLGTGSSYTLSVQVLPEHAANKKVKWKSSKKSVVTVSSKGVLTAKKKGTATITCTAKDGSGVKATCKVTVKKVKFSARVKRPTASNKHFYSSQNIYYLYNQYAPTKIPFAEGKYCAGNCTWYACGRASEILTKAGEKVDLSIFGGNPMAIWNKNKLQNTFPYGTTPKVGALVVFGPQYGSYHIAVVEKISGDTVYVSESGYKTVNKKPKASNIVFHYGTIDTWNHGREIIGYIYLI